MSTKRSLVFSAALTLLASTPCYALDFYSLVDTVLGARTSASLGTQLQNQGELTTTINTREAQIGNEIDAGVRAGLLTNDEQAELRRDLNQFEFIQGSAYADKNLDAHETRQLVDSLSNISSKLNVYMTNNAKTGFAADLPTSTHGNKYGWWMNKYGGGKGQGNDSPRNQERIQAMIDAEQAELDSAINRALYERKISSSQASTLRTKLQAVATAETTAQADGRITFAERDSLINSLNQVDVDIKAAIAQGPERRWARRGGPGNRPQGSVAYGSYLRNRIESALAAGKI
jgi:hypothetical protein